MPLKQRLDTTWWKVARPNVHSRKPESFQDVIEQVSDMPRLEMFARRYRLGWDAFGNEVESHVEIPVRSLTQHAPDKGGRVTAE